MTIRLAIVGRASAGAAPFPGAVGKMPPDFLPPFEWALTALDIKISHHTFRQFIDAGVQVDAVLFVYSEINSRRSADVWSRIEQAGEAADARKVFVVHGPLIGRIVADKTLTHQALSAAGIPMPRMLSGASLAPFRVFSNEKQASHASVLVINPGDRLIPDRYNTGIDRHRPRFHGQALLRCIARDVRRPSLPVNAR